MSFGALLSNVISEVIVTKLGWRHRFQIFASIIFVVGLPCVATFKPAIESTSSREENSDTIVITKSNRCEALITLCKTPAFYLWLFATLCWSVSYYLPSVFLIDYMESIGIPSATGAWVLTAYGVTSFVGRILAAVIGEKIMAYGSMFGEDSCRRFSLASVYVVCSVIAGLVTMLTPQWKYLGVVYAYVIVIGCTTSALQSVMFASTMQFFGDKLGIDVWGYANLTLAIGMVTGPVVSGAIYDVTGSYVSALYMCGGLFFACAFTTSILPIVLRHSPPKLEVMSDAVIRNDHVTDVM
uniref:monocarboxylate transporter 5-like isoform X2 n=1 Tax=Ciona intestinalis TaxID=7719 RepID=UPI00089DC0F4|nr:monocarboxylate transporter 5-like isoform X2 [Ciona intestinalis]|eukprot:XP_018671592.1 monocarboxylate transporter 5-like isoform X2 [Ciona intestinalis]